MSVSHTDRQKSVFSQFLNSLLPEEYQIQSPDDLPKAVSSGLLLLRLLEILIKQTYNRDAHFIDQLNQVNNPNIYQKMENIRIALQYLKDDEGIDMVNLDAKGIVDENEKLVLGLVWRIINHFHVSRKAARKASEEKEQLLQSFLSEERHVGVVRELSELEERFSDVLKWVNSTLQNAGMDDSNATNMTSSWTEPTLLRNLIIAIGGSDAEGSLSNFEGDDLYQACLDYAAEKFHIPKLLSVHDFQDPDKMIMSTYLAYFRDFALEQEKHQILQQNQVQEEEINNIFENTKDNQELNAQEVAPAENHVQNHLSNGFENQESINSESTADLEEPQENSAQNVASTEEVSPIVAMQRKRQERLMELSTLARQKREESKQKSLEQKENILRERKERIEKKHKTIVEEEKRQSEYMNEGSSNSWEQVAKYCNFSADAPPQPKDSQRYKKLIIQLKNQKV